MPLTSRAASYTSSINFSERTAMRRQNDFAAMGPFGDAKRICCITSDAFRLRTTFASSFARAIAHAVTLSKTGYIPITSRTIALSHISNVYANANHILFSSGSRELAPSENSFRGSSPVIRVPDSRFICAIAKHSIQNPMTSSTNSRRAFSARTLRTTFVPSAPASRSVSSALAFFRVFELLSANMANTPGKLPHGVVQISSISTRASSSPSSDVPASKPALNASEPAL